MESWAAAENWAVGSHGTFWNIKNIPRGATTPVPVMYVDSVGGQLIPWNGSVGPDSCCSVDLPWGWELVKNDVALVPTAPGSNNQGAALIYNNGTVNTTSGAFETYTLELDNNRSVASGTNQYTNTVLGINVQDNTSHQVNQALEIEDGEGNGITKIMANGHYLSGPGTHAAPVLSACGTSPAYTANSPASDAVGRITTGTTNTGCVITFNTTYTKIPACWCMDETSTANLTACIPTATTLTFTLSANSSNVISYQCTGPTSGGT